jgi:hypothetical protein
MALLTLTDARNLMLKGKPWTFRMEFHGTTPNGNPSHKFWVATGRARHEPVEIHFGAVGAASNILIKDWDYVERAAPEKEAKGYTYITTPFVRVQQATINTWLASQGKPVSVPPTPVQPVAPQPPVQPAAPKPPTPVQPAAPVSGLPGPWGRILSVQKQADGSWWGLDAAGAKVIPMTRNGAMNLVQSQPHISVLGL